MRCLGQLIGNDLHVFHSCTMGGTFAHVLRFSARLPQNPTHRMIQLHWLHEVPMDNGSFGWIQYCFWLQWTYQGFTGFGACPFRSMQAPCIEISRFRSANCSLPWQIRCKPLWRFRLALWNGCLQFLRTLEHNQRKKTLVWCTKTFWKTM